MREQLKRRKFKLFLDKPARGWRPDLRWVLEYPNGDSVVNCSFDYALRRLNMELDKPVPLFQRVRERLIPYTVAICFMILICTLAMQSLVR